MAYTGKGGAVNDLVLLDDLNEGSIVECLGSHHSHKEIYTYIGPVLLSVNPYTDISNLYSAQKIKKYTLKKPYENAPHVFALSESAYRSMLSDLRNQCIVVTGESGSGKTEASKRVMQYVAAMSSKASDVQRIKKQLLQSNPLLESFGNAKTIRNDNSSRFGKFMQMSFRVGDPVGGQITTYLLEKSRVTRQQNGERNFHVFYELLSSRKCKEYGLSGNISDYKFLCDPDADAGEIDDNGNFSDVTQAMDLIGFPSEAVDAVFRAVAFILHIGNLKFGSQGKIKNKDVVGQAADLLKLDVKSLEKALTYKTVKSGMESIKSPLSKKDAISVRDSLAQSLYQAIFDFIVGSANDAISVDKYSTSLGVLDIYGFEILGVNGFEQLCINYTNEKLHQLFIALTLNAEQKEYKNEGIKWKKIEFFDNLQIITMVEKQLSRSIDDETIFPNGSDASLYNKLVKNLRLKSTNSHENAFMITHYAGDVEYSTNGFLERNRDKLSPDVVQLMNKSNLDIISQLFKQHMNARASVKVYKKTPSAITQYKASVTDLINTLNTAEQHYIRCIKPNASKRGGLYERDLVQTQIRYLGILENVKVRRAGFAFRMLFDEFAAKYKCVLPVLEAQDGDVVVKILKKFAQGEAFEKGKTKIFIKDAKSLLKIEGKRQAFLEQARGFLPPEEQTGTGVLFADKVRGFDGKFVRKDLTFVVGVQGLYWYTETGDVAQYFPLEKVEYIGYNDAQRWMTVHMSYPSKVEGEKVELTYLSEGIYARNVENFIEVLHSMGFTRIDGRKSGAYPNDAVDEKEYKALVKQIAKDGKPTVKKGKGVKKKRGFRFAFPKLSFLARLRRR